MDSKKRSLVKSVVWRIIGVVLLAVIAFLITGNLKEMTIITVVFHAIRMVMYYFHERVWERITWGRKQHPLAELPVREKLTPDDRQILEDKLRELGYMD